MFKEFKEFALKGNLVDMAVAVVIGGAFGAVAKSLTDDIFMGLLAGVLGKTDFRSMFVVLRQGDTAGAHYATLEEALKDHATVLGYGSLLTTIISFLIVAFAMFLVVKAMNSLKKKEAETPAAPDAQLLVVEKLEEIRKLLSK